MFGLLLISAHSLDAYLSDLISRSDYGSHLMSSTLGRIITEILFLAFIAVLSYETIYHAGIYLQLWDYHAKHIFKEIPVHCAHVYVDLNFISADTMRETRRECASDESKFTPLKAIQGASAFKFPAMIKYHLEFSPDDFESNPEPELGSTIGHLRNKILGIVKDSEYYASKIDNLGRLTADSVCIFDRKSNEITTEKNDAYLANCGIETGHTVVCVIVL